MTELKRTKKEERNREIGQLFGVLFIIGVIVLTVIAVGNITEDRKERTAKKWELYHEKIETGFISITGKEVMSLKETSGRDGLGNYAVRSGDDIYRIRVTTDGDILEIVQGAKIIYGIGTTGTK